MIRWSAARELRDASSECGVGEAGAEDRGRAAAGSAAMSASECLAYEQDTGADARSWRLYERDAWQGCERVGGVSYLRPVRSGSRYRAWR